MPQPVKPEMSTLPVAMKIHTDTSSASTEGEREKLREKLREKEKVLTAVSIFNKLLGIQNCICQEEKWAPLGSRSELHADSR